MKKLLEEVRARDPDQAEFLQAVDEILSTMQPLFEKRPEYVHVARVMFEPERVVQFRVPWIDDEGVQRVNRGWRVQMNNAIGPYKGGLRFHPSMNLSIAKFLASEQVLKNALTGLSLGGGKGGSNFNPKGRSDREVLAFCTSFMTELYRHIGSDVDVPAGDIGVGAREIGYLHGAYKRTTSNSQGGVLTGKGPTWGGSLIRPEATGYGVVFITRALLRDSDETLEGKRVLVSGSGNVAQYTAEKLIELGAKVLTLSDSGGHVYEEAGFTREQLDQVMRLKNERRGRLSEYRSETGVFVKGERPWRAGYKADVAIPAATQNEVDEEDARALHAKSGITTLTEAANMPCTTPAIELLKSEGVRFVPAKAANAGGVAVSGLEMAQNGSRISWSREEVEGRLVTIMEDIYSKCKDAAATVGKEGDLQLGANVAGFIRVADAMIAQGQAFVQ